jgi:probable rRNA maturation factor
VGLSDSSPQISTGQNAIDLDLAFCADADLAPELLAAAGHWCGASPAAEQAWQQLLTGWLIALQGELPPRLQSTTYSLSLSLVSDGEIAALNQDWRAKAGPTDVLAFAAQDDDPPMPTGLEGLGELELGDIVISLETAARQAPEHDNSLEQELLFLASHGLLHLLGWDHPDDASLTAMLERQAELVQQR